MYIVARGSDHNLAGFVSDEDLPIVSDEDLPIVSDEDLPICSVDKHQNIAVAFLLGNRYLVRIFA